MSDELKPMTEAEVLAAYRRWIGGYGTTDIVIVKRMTEADAIARFNLRDFSQCRNEVLRALRGLRLLREETLAERYTRETGKEATPEVIAALEWASKL